MENNTIRFDTHVCMVSAQATPNLAPIMSAEFRPKHVILLVSKEMTKQADVMAALLKKYQVSCEILRIDAYDTEAMQEQMLDLLIQHSEDSIALNVTGGTKLMAIVAQEVFRAENKPVFYVNIDTNAIQFVGAKSTALQLKSTIKLEDYLSVHGYQVQGNLLKQINVSRDRKVLTETLIKDVKLFSNAIGRLNYSASIAESNDVRRGREVVQHCLSVEVDEHNLTDPHWSRVIDLFEQAGILTLKGKTLKFSDKDARFYANGGWLEDHVFSIVKDLSVQEAALSVLVENQSGSGHAQNELDIAFLANNRLHLIECKARIFTDKDSKGADALYKLDSLAALGGIATKCMLVSYRTLRDADKQRAKDLRIKTIEADQLGTLKNQLQSWMALR